MKSVVDSPTKNVSPFGWDVMLTGTWVTVRVAGPEITEPLELETVTVKLLPLSVNCGLVKEKVEDVAPAIAVPFFNH